MNLQRNLSTPESLGEIIRYAALSVKQNYGTVLLFLALLMSINIARRWIQLDKCLFLNIQDAIFCLQTTNISYRVVVSILLSIFFAVFTAIFVQKYSILGKINNFQFAFFSRGIAAGFIVVLTSSILLFILHEIYDANYINIISSYYFRHFRDVIYIPFIVFILIFDLSALLMRIIIETLVYSIIGVLIPLAVVSGRLSIKSAVFRGAKGFRWTFGRLLLIKSILGLILFPLSFYRSLMRYRNPELDNYYINAVFNFPFFVFQIFGVVVTALLLVNTYSFTTKFREENIFE